MAVTNDSQHTVILYKHFCVWLWRKNKFQHLSKFPNYNCDWSVDLQNAQVLLNPPPNNSAFKKRLPVWFLCSSVSRVSWGLYPPHDLAPEKAGHKHEWKHPKVTINVVIKNMFKLKKIKQGLSTCTAKYTTNG